MGRLALFSLAACALAGVVIAQAQPPGAAAAASGAPATSSAPAEAQAADPLICKWEEETGSMLGRHKLCLTKSQWEQSAYESEDMMNDNTRRSYQAGTVGH